MKKVLAYLSVPLLLAACSAPSTPQGNTDTAVLRAVKVNAASVASFRPQGINETTPELKMDVRVRTSDGNEVHFFKDTTTYDPTGTGTTVITLDRDNNYARDLLLPEGSYSFQVAGLEAKGGTTLLTYGPGSENTATVDAAGATVRLKAHSVLNPAASTLETAMNLPILYTDMRFTLNLRLKTASVNGTAGAVPTSDIGAVTYSVGAASDGDLALPGSKLGVQVTSRGSDTDSELNVAANFNAWVRVAGTDTAAYTPVQINFAKQIQKNTIGADMTPPEVTFQAPATIGLNAVGTLSGTANDAGGVRSIQVYDGVTLIASNDEDDRNVALVTSDSSGAWSAPWTGTELGTHELTVVVNDYSGNEKQVSVDGTVSAVVATDVTIASDGIGESNFFGLTAGVPQTFKLHLGPTTTTSLLMFIDQNSADPTPKGFTQVLTDANGTVIPLTDQLGEYEKLSYTEERLPAGTYTLKVMPSANTTMNIYGMRF